MSDKSVLLEKRGNIAIIKLNKPKKLNAVSAQDWFDIACHMHDIAADDKITITVLTGEGRFFSAGADVTTPRAAPSDASKEHPRKAPLHTGVPQNLHITHAFYTHPKILVAALNGPAVGLSAALAAHADFIYAAPHTFLLTPFSSLGLVSEGLAAQTFVQRMGIGKANEALLQSKKLSCEELVQCGFINKVIDAGIDPKKEGYADAFLEKVLAEVEDRMGDHLSHSSMLEIKKLIRQPYQRDYDAQGVHEVMGLMNRFLAGIPQKEFARMASGEKKHKL